MLQRLPHQRRRILRLMLCCIACLVTRGSCGGITSSLFSLISPKTPIINSLDADESLIDAINSLVSAVADLKEENQQLRDDIWQVQRRVEALQDGESRQHQIQPQQYTQEKRNRQKNSTEPTSLISSPEQQQQQQQRHQQQQQQQQRRSLRGAEAPTNKAQDDATIKSSTSARIKRLEDKLACVSEESDGDNLYLEGCNLHIRDGSGSTFGPGSYGSSSYPSSEASRGGRGNLIVGYNEAAQTDVSGDDRGAPSSCSLPGAEYHNNAALCREHGGVYGQSLKIGHHNIIVGAGHSYTQHSGLVVGYKNAVAGVGASVIGGLRNHALGDHTSIVGGADNVAIGSGSVVVSGYDNAASGEDSSIVGGNYNFASGVASSIIGGTSHQTRGESSFVGGGSSNQAFGELASITSGYSNTATAKLSSICGGYDVIVDQESYAFSGGGFFMHHHQVVDGL